MENINIGHQIALLRKKNNETQDQLAKALNISAQAVSKWETNTCQPDTLTLPLIAKHFHVSVDYLFFGRDISYDDVYEKVFYKVRDHGQFQGYEDALMIFGNMHMGLFGGFGWDGKLSDCPNHVSDPNGISLVSGKGYAALVLRRFFKQIDSGTVLFAQPIFAALSDRDCLTTLLAIISMSDISYYELLDKTKLHTDELRQALDKLMAVYLVEEMDSKHKSLGTTYQVASTYHTCLCILLATMEMQRDSLNGISCCMGYGDYPIAL